MLETLLFIGGAVGAYGFVALRQRVPGEKWTDTIVRPFGAGGPGPRR